MPPRWSSPVSFPGLVLCLPISTLKCWRLLSSRTLQARGLASQLAAVEVSSEAPSSKPVGGQPRTSLELYFLLTFVTTHMNMCGGTEPMSQNRSTVWLRIDSGVKDPPTHSLTMSRPWFPAQFKVPPSHSFRISQPYPWSRH